LMIILFYIWVLIGISIGTAGVFYCEMNGILIKKDDVSDRQHRIVLGVFIFFVLFLGTVLGPIPLILSSFQKNQ